MGSLKLLGWLAGWDRDGWGEGGWTKNQGGAQAFFWKILHTKKKKFWARAPFALRLGPSLWLGIVVVGGGGSGSCCSCGGCWMGFFLIIIFGGGGWQWLAVGIAVGLLG